ncbi:hypothetical protein QFC19_002202 [Naganishia cerealis]|uniref:Uncharacterized protein n=1 Tax=Naganishia cerealis TaxID=610337 RepID=A0ACC2WCI9_9TREE|nr:hypothetical protein QFC19_002202 [Naganishia cerealis]
MTGLASKWATEPTLVQQAEAQDKKKPTKPATGNPLESSEKHQITSSAPVRKPLISKWADAAVGSKEDERKESPKSPRGEERHRRNSKNRRNSETRRKDEVNGQTLRNREKRKGRNGGSKHDEPRERQEKHTTSSEESRTHPVTNEILPSMSKAAASFALRLGVPNGSGAPNVDNKSTPPDSKSVNDSDEYETTDDSDDNRNVKQPMSKAGMSFAARLAIPPKANNSKNINKDVKKDQARPSTQKYMSPKQRREAEKLEQEQQRRQEQKQRDAKLQEEVRDMFSKMTASTANWADLEDE